MKKSKNVTKYIRVNEDDWNQAAEICSDMGTTLSAVYGQMVKQIIIQRRIPFQLTLHKIGTLPFHDVNARIKEENQDGSLKWLYDELGADMSEEAYMDYNGGMAEKEGHPVPDTVEDCRAALDKLCKEIFND